MGNRDGERVRTAQKDKHVTEGRDAGGDLRSGARGACGAAAGGIVGGALLLAAKIHVSFFFFSAVWMRRQQRRSVAAAAAVEHDDCCACCWMPVVVVALLHPPPRCSLASSFCFFCCGAWVGVCADVLRCCCAGAALPALATKKAERHLPPQGIQPTTTKEARKHGEKSSGGKNSTPSTTVTPAGR